MFKSPKITSSFYSSLSRTLTRGSHAPLAGSPPLPYREGSPLTEKGSEPCLAHAPGGRRGPVPRLIVSGWTGVRSILAVVPLRSPRKPRRRLSDACVSPPKQRYRPSSILCNTADFKTPFARYLPSLWVGPWARWLGDSHLSHLSHLTLMVGTASQCAEVAR